jgi:hypothetical protein
MNIYVDIDETICNTPENRDYKKSTPIKENIKKINNMYDKVHTIVYWTARGSGSGKDHSKITREQLKKWGVKFHKLKLGKPSYDLFICDKAVNSRYFFKTID